METWVHKFKVDMELVKLTVVLYFVFVIECTGMLLDELEDFKNFLIKTSHLDQNLKKGTDPDDDYDEEEAASDHAWEESGKFEGDLILNDRQRRLIVQNVAEGLSRNGLKDSTKRWPNNEVIFYIQKEHFTGDQVQAILSGIDDLGQASCIKFRPYKKGDRDAVVVQGSRRGCFSQVGYQGGYQVLNLSGRHPVGRGCFRHGTVIHELLHTLGFYHMQSSPDRDDFIDVLWENIIEPARHNFRKYNSFAVSDFGVGYDYDSVLHYSRRAFSANGQDTLVPKQNGASIGQRTGLSDKDTQKLNKMYCDTDSDTQNADEETNEKPTKKKSPKNKPFQGHGIGYHQGKAVVIKLLPAAETYKLPDVPTFHLFDYFSKAPQALPATKIEGHRTGKELTSLYNPHASLSIDTHNKQSERENIETNDNATKISIQEFKDNNHFEDKFPSSVKESKDKENHEQTIGNEQSTSDVPPNELSEALYRLSKIVKSHVYPSQNYDIDVYKLNDNYSKFYTPPKSAHNENSETYYSSSPVKLKNEDRKYTKDFIANLYDSPHTIAEAQKLNIKYESDADDKEATAHNSEDIESYRTSFPIKEQFVDARVRYTGIPEYISFENHEPVTRLQQHIPTYFRK